MTTRISLTDSTPLHDVHPLSTDRAVAVIDPTVNPILAAHWFDLETRPPLPEVTRQFIGHKIAGLHRRGPGAIESVLLKTLEISDCRTRDVILRSIAKATRVGEVADNHGRAAA